MAYSYLNATLTMSSPAVKSEELKSSPKVPATTLKTPKPESGSPDKTLVKSPNKKEAKITPKKENPLEVDIKKEEVEEEKPKPTEALEHRVIFATEGDHNFCCNLEQCQHFPS